MGEDSTDEPRRLTVAQAAAQLGITEGAVRSRIKRGTITTERRGGTVYVVFAGDEPPPYIGEPADEPSADHRLIDSYEDRIESLERQLAGEREARRRADHIIAALTERIPELEAPPQASPESAQEAEDVAESASEGADRKEAAEEPTEAQDLRPWWRRLLGNRVR